MLQVSQPTALDLRFKLAVQQINIGDIIEIFLDSHNLIRQMYSFTSTKLECAEGISGILTASVDLICDVFQYPVSKKPLIVRVYPKKVVPINTQIEIWISPLINPSASMVAGAELKVTRDCKG